MLFMANQGYTTATDFADYLVKNKNLSFRESYAISAKVCLLYTSDAADE